MNTKNYNSMEAIKNNFYVVKKGREVGIFSTWEEVKRLTDNFPNNDHCLVNGKNDALGALKDALEIRLINDKLSPKEIEVLEFCRVHYDPNDSPKYSPIF